jgi:hypothetical protein
MVSDMQLSTRKGFDVLSRRRVSGDASAMGRFCVCYVAVHNGSLYTLTGITVREGRQEGQVSLLAAITGRLGPSLRDSGQTAFLVLFSTSTRTRIVPPSLPPL